MVTNMVRKDVLRTDRQHKFYSGENNENINALYNILTTFALHHPSVGYCQVILFYFFFFLLTASCGSHGSMNSFFVNGTLLRKVNGSSSFCKGPRTSKV